jgi:hypothetical protein
MWVKQRRGRCVGEAEEREICGVKQRRGRYVGEAEEREMCGLP